MLIEESFIVEGMGCENCAKKVEKTLKQLPGVKSVKVDLDTGKVLLKSKEQQNRESILAAIDNLGYIAKF